MTGNDVYFKKATRVMEHLDSLPKTDGLVPMFIDAHNGEMKDCCSDKRHSHTLGGFASSTITLGARGDSYYEYLLKQWVQTGKVQTLE